jgi:hypothetical protein
VFAEATISAPPSAVYMALLDTSTWADWNTFVPSVTINKRPSTSSETVDTRLQKDMALSFHVNMTSTMTTTSKELVTQVDKVPSTLQPGQTTRVIWIMDNKSSMTPRFLLSAERVNEIEDLGDGTCVYRSWETFGGILAHIVKWKFEQTLQKNFQDWVVGLQQYIQNKERTPGERDAAIEMSA